MTVLLVVGDVEELKLPKNNVTIHCDDLEDLLECIHDVVDEYDTYIVLIGENVIMKAHWNEDCKCYGDIVDKCKVVEAVEKVFDGEIR